MYQVHYRDRRDNRRAVHTETRLEWHKGSDFNYADGNWSADCNRSREMYPREPVLHVSTSSAKCVLVVEKIVIDGKVVYRDEGIVEGVDSDAADMADARLFGAYSAVTDLKYGLLETDADFPARIKVAQHALSLLTDCPQHEGVREIIESAIAAAQNVYKMDVCMNLRWTSDIAALDKADDEISAIYKARKTA